MLYGYIIEKLLEFKEVNLTKFKKYNNEKHIYLHDDEASDP